MNNSSSDSSLSSTHRRREHKKKRHKSAHAAAPSDYAQLRKHFQFVLPDEDYDDTSNSKEKYGSTWQQRMVRHYHSHLYKEYVLADLSRVLSERDGRGGGPVGLRWRTAAEVKDGKGFTTCGNLACQCTPGKDDEYNRKVRSALGVGVAENGGSVPTGVLLPSDEGSKMIERYLHSCEREARKANKKEAKRKHHKRSRDGADVVSKRREAKEQKRLSRISYGVGLHDYEVDFAYVEKNEKKRELVKVRLCLRCAPLIFGGWAVKARFAREKAARAAGTSEAVDESAQHDQPRKDRANSLSYSDSSCSDESLSNSKPNIIKKLKSS